MRTYSPEIGYDEQAEVAQASWSNRSPLWLLFSIEGRIPRMAYWFASLIVLGAYLTAVILAATFIRDQKSLQLATALLNLPLLWVSVALQVKRWHDRDKSGWWFLICFIPIIGSLWSFIELGFFRGTYGPNRFGEET